MKMKNFVLLFALNLFFQSAYSNICYELFQNDTVFQDKGASRDRSKPDIASGEQSPAATFWGNLSTALVIKGVRFQPNLDFSERRPRLQELSTEKLPQGNIVSDLQFSITADHREASGELGAPKDYDRPVLSSYMATSNQQYGSIQLTNVVISFADVANIQKILDSKHLSKGPVFLGKINGTGQPVALALFERPGSTGVDTIYLGGEDHSFTSFRTNPRVKGLNDLDPYFYGVHSLKSGEKTATAFAYSLPPAGAKLERGGDKFVTLETLQNYIQRNAYDSQFHEGAPNSGMVALYITTAGKLVYLPDHYGSFYDWSGAWLQANDVADTHKLKVSNEANNKMAVRWKNDKHLKGLMDALAKNDPKKLIAFFEWLKEIDRINAQRNKALEGDDFYARNLTAELSRYKALLNLAARESNLERPARERNPVPAKWLSVLLGYAHEKNINIEDFVPSSRPWVQEGKIMGSRSLKRGDHVVFKILQADADRQRNSPAIPVDTSVIARFDRFTKLLDGSVRMVFTVTWSEGNRVQQKQSLVLDSWALLSLKAYIVDPAEIISTNRGNTN